MTTHSVAASESAAPIAFAPPPDAQVAIGPLSDPEELLAIARTTGLPLLLVALEADKLARVPYPALAGAGVLLFDAGGDIRDLLAALQRVIAGAPVLAVPAAAIARWVAPLDGLTAREWEVIIGLIAPRTRRWLPSRAGYRPHRSRPMSSACAASSAGAAWPTRWRWCRRMWLPSLALIQRRSRRAARQAGSDDHARGGEGCRSGDALGSNATMGAWRAYDLRGIAASAKVLSMIDVALASGAIRFGSVSMDGAAKAVARAHSMTHTEPLTTPDGRYLIVRGRLWRRTNPALSEEARQALVQQLMQARRGVAVARRQGDAAALRAARTAVQQAKEGLGERGPVWWDDGAPDYTRFLVKNTPYRDWYAALPPSHHHEP